MRRQFERMQRRKSMYGIIMPISNAKRGDGNATGRSRNQDDLATKADRNALAGSAAKSTARTPIQDTSTGSKPVRTITAKQVGPTINARDSQKWERVLAQLKARLGPEAFASWFGRCRLETVSKSQLTISVPTTFLRSWIKTLCRLTRAPSWTACQTGTPTRHTGHASPGR